MRHSIFIVALSLLLNLVMNETLLNFDHRYDCNFYYYHLYINLLGPDFELETLGGTETLIPQFVRHYL